MNAITQQNNQALLHDHYNQANQAFQAGNFAQALNELEQALQYAENEKQAAHIQQSIRTVSEMMSQEPPNGSMPPEAHSESPVAEETTPGTGSNKMLLLTVLVGLICLTPIVMKCIEIFAAPSVKTEETVQTSTQTTNTQPASPAAVNAGAPASPASTPDVIVEGSAAAKWNVTGSGINMRESASTKAASLAKLSAGEEVTMVEANAAQADGYVWSKITTAAGTTGWVASQFLKEQAAPAAPASAPVDAAAAPADPAAADAAGTTSAAPVDPAAAAAGPTRSVGGNGVSLRAQPGTKAALITTLSRSQVTVLEDKAAQADGYTWTKIRTANGVEGWVADQFLGN